jgi:hypothetical protein
MSERFKMNICKRMVKPFTMYGCETWRMIEVDMERVNTWLRKILRMICGSAV